MATTVLEQPWPAEFVRAEAPGTLSRENVILVPSAGLKAGTVLGKITLSGKYTEYNNAATTGAEIARAILLTEVLGSASDQMIAVIDALAEVESKLLVWGAGQSEADKTAGLADLATRFIKAR